MLNNFITLINKDARNILGKKDQITILNHFKNCKDILTIIYFHLKELSYAILEFELTPCL